MKIITCCHHEWACKPIPTSFGSIADKMRQKLMSRKAGDPFEASAIAHNKVDIKDGNDISPDFRCKKCDATKEVDHITRDKNGNITKIVQCKSDHSQAVGGESKKGVIIKPKQLKEDRKLIVAINACQHKTGVIAYLEYKLESGVAAENAKTFLMKNNPPLVTMIKRE
ncbi:MAG: hypothetical protein KAH77_05325 [Thiomargarita sp.]|nr:hypothetical protein [Thiomargarita sp.]